MQATSPRARGPFMWDFFGLMPPDGEAQEGDYYSGFEFCQPLLPAGVEWQPYERQGLYMAVRIELQERLKGSGQDRAGGMMGYAESAEGTAAKIEKVDMMGHAESPKGAQTDAEGAPIEQVGIEKDDKSAEAAKTDTDAANQVGITKDAKRSAEAAKIEQEGMKGADTIAQIPQIGKSSAENDQAEMPIKMRRVGSSASAGGNDDDEDDNFIDADALEAYLNARGMNPNVWGKICRVKGSFEECFVDGSMDDISDPFENPAISLVDVLKTLNMKFTYKGTEYDSRAKRPTM